MTGLESWTDEELERARRRVADSLPGLADFTPASLHEEWRRCGKPNCRCARDGDPGHGPRHTLVRREDGRVVTRQVPAGMVAEFAARTAGWAQFQAACAQLAGINAELDRRRLRRGVGVRPATAAEKGGPGSSRPTSPR